EGSLAAAERALTMYRTLHRDGPVPGLLNIIAISYRHLGEVSKAIDVYQEGLALLDAQPRPDPATKAYLLNNLANARQALGDYQGALNALSNSLALSREIGHKDNEARALADIGQGYFQQGDYAKALEYQRDALAIRRHFPHDRGTAQALQLSGATEHPLGHHEQALSSLTEALEIWRHIGQQDAEVHTLEAL